MATRADVAIAVALLLAVLGELCVGAEAQLVAMAHAADDEGTSSPSTGDRQDESGAAPASDPGNDGRAMWLRCPTPAKAHRLYWECVGQPIGSITETLTRDWAGFRTFLGAFGISPVASYTAQLMGNPSGGRTQGFTYAGSFDAGISWDLEKFLGIPRLSFFIGASWSSGKNLTTEDIGNLFFVQSAFTGTGQVTLQQMYVQQGLLDGALSIAAGRLAPANTFATLPVFNYYLSGGVNPIPGSLGYNDPAFAQSPPGTEWGIQIAYQPIVPLLLSVGVYNANPAAANGADHGVDFSFGKGGTGVLTVFEVTYRLNQAKTDTGLPGEYTIGGFYDTSTFSNLSPPPGTMTGNWAVYAMFQQMVYRDGPPGSLRGVTIWGEVAVSPRQSASLFPYFMGGGLSCQGLLPTRESDVASVGVVSGILSRHVRNASAETVFEANYNAVLPFGISITPDVQYIIKPSGNSRIKNALVIGAQLAVSF